MAIGIGSLTINEWQHINFELAKPHPSYTQIGQITKEGKWNHLVNGLLHHNQPRLTHLIKNLNAAFGRLEQKGIKFFDAAIAEASFLKKAQIYQDSFGVYFDLVKKIEVQMNAFNAVSPLLKQAYHELKCREIGLRYSLGKENGGLGLLDKPEEALLSKLSECALAWKKKEKLCADTTLNALDHQQLEKLACYPHWLKLVLEDPAYLELVFNWTLRDYNPVDIVVTCFDTSRKLKAAILPPYVGFVTNPARSDPKFQVLSFQNVPTKVEGVYKRILTASIYHGSYKTFEPEKQERINILKPTEPIHFQQGNYTLTVEEFLKECAEKNNREININLCADWGFVNFHPVKGVWNADKEIYEMPAMTEQNWVYHIPMGRIETHEALLAQYGDKIKDSKFFFKVMATRQDLNLNALKSHTFWRLYLRMEDGNWKILNLGFYADRFQTGLIDGLQMVCATLQRVMSLLDQNACYVHRQRVGFPIFPSAALSEQFLKRIYKWINTPGVIQFLGRNCAYKIQKETQKVFSNAPNFFQIPFTKTTVGMAPLDLIIKWADRQGEWIRWFVLTILHTIALSHREMTLQRKKGLKVYSVKEYIQKGNQMYNPAYLAEQILEGRKTDTAPFNKGEVYWSHIDEKLYEIAALKEKEGKEPLEIL